MAVLPLEDRVLLERDLTMPVMLVPMFLRLDVYAGSVGHAAHTTHAARR